MNPRTYRFGAWVACASLSLLSACSHHAPSLGDLEKPYVEEQAKIKEQIYKIYEDFKTQDMAAIDATHFYNDKFTKFDVVGKDRLNAEGTKASEAHLIKNMIKTFNFKGEENIQNLQISVYGNFAVATFTLLFDAELQNTMKLKAPFKSSLVFVNTGSAKTKTWKIVHEHFSLPVEMKDLPLTK